MGRVGRWVWLASLLIGVALTAVSLRAQDVAAAAAEASAGALGSLTHELPANALLTLLIVPILQWAKRHEAGWLSWINERTAFSLSAVVAFFGAVGIHFSFDPTAGTATIDGLTITGLLGGGAEWLKQFAAQHWGHRFYRALESVGGKV